MLPAQSSHPCFPEGTTRLKAAEKRCGPWFDKLTMRFKPLKTLDLILSLSKDEAGFSAVFSILLDLGARLLRVRPEKCEAVFR